MSFELNTILVFTSIVVVIVIIYSSYKEMQYAVAHAKAVIDFPKSIATIKAGTLNNKHEIYIVNTKSIDKNNINDYIVNFKTLDNVHEYVIKEHLNELILKPIRKSLAMLKSFPRTRTPLNTLYHSLSNTESVIESLNPLSNTDGSEYHMIVDDVDKTNVDVFIYKNKIYFI